MRLSGTEAWDRDATTPGRGPVSRVLERLFVVWILLSLVLIGQPAAPVLASGDPPIANDQSESTREATPLGLFLDASDPEFDPLTFTIVDPPNNGTLDDCTSGSCTYTPDSAPNFLGTDTFTWTANDGISDSNVATFTVEVTANTAPVANDQTESTREAKPLAVFLEGSDDDDDPLTFTIVDPPNNGTLDDCTSGSCTYTPDSAPNFLGTDTFTWTANDGISDSNVATFTVEVTANTAPVANDQTESTREAKPLAVFLEGSDDDDDPLTFTIVDPPNNGTLDDCTSGSCTYTPDSAPNFLGTDTFTWTANDGISDSNVATFTVEVTANTAPVANDQTESTREAKPLAVFLEGSDDDDDPLTFTIVDPPNNGTLDDCTSGSCTYTPDSAPNFLGTDTFTWTANDGISDSNVATFTVEVTANTAPVANDDIRVLRDVDVATIDLPAADADDDPLTFTIVDPPNNGTLDDCTSGSCTFTPGPTFATSDSFTWKANDGLADSNVATFTIRVVAGPLEMAQAMAADQSVVSGASYVTIPPNGTPNDVYQSELSFFPTTGSAFTILTSGDAALADDPNVSESSGAGNGGGAVRGDSDRDVTILKVDLTVPTGINCLRLDFAFYSDEFPEFVGSSVNDGFVAELDTSSWTVSESVITAPDNFALDPEGNVISINSSGVTSMSAPNAAGTTYDGATTLLQAGTPISPGAHSLFLSIFDQGDDIYDSAVFVDNLRLLTLPSPETQCAEGAVEANDPPSVDAGGPYAGNEGASISLDGTATDPDTGDTLTSTWSYAPGAGVDAGATCIFGSASAVDTTVSCTDDGTYTLTLTVSDGVNPDVLDTASLTLANASPTVAISAPSDGSDHGLGDEVSVSAAVADAGDNDTHTCFIEWGDDTGSAGTLGAAVCTGSHTYAAAGPYTITVTASDDDEGDGNDSVDITVSAGSHTLTVSLAGDGSGSVSSSPTGIDCPTDCTEAYDDGTLVTLTAVADSGSSFAGWSGDCSGTEGCSVTMDAARSVTATFTLDPVSFALDVTLAGDGSGSVSSDPAGIDCPTDCSESYLEDTLVTLTAAPASGSSFAGWSGDCSGTEGCSVTMGAARSVTATFDIDVASLTVNTTSDADDGSCTVAHCTLREAIASANGIAGTDTITFAIPGDGPHIISLSSALPTIIDSAVIDGTSEPGFTDCTSGVMVELDGSGAGTGAGLNVTAGGTTIRGLAVNGFDAAQLQAGIRLATGGGNAVECSLIGTDASGTTALPNSIGILVASSASNSIGGPGVGNVISGNSFIGLDVEGSPAGTSNVVQSNVIGLNITGTEDLGNGGWGVVLFTPSNTVGGPLPGEGNVISGNATAGLSLQSGANTVTGNRIGTDAAGMVAVPNFIGIEVWGDLNQIGGTGSGAGNQVSGNAPLDGIIVRSTASSNVMQGNLIGLDATGAGPLPNRMGVWLDESQSNTIGGTAAGARNVISGNTSVGILVQGSGSAGNAIQGNLIGTDATGTAGMPNNGGIGIEGGASGNTVGGSAAGAGNVIAHNLSGITVFGDSTTGNSIVSNAIHSNLGMGIDLIGTSGVTANDAGDPDIGPNDLQNFPVLTSATTDAGVTTVEGTLNSTPDTTFTLQLFTNGVCDASGYGEGESLLASHTVITDEAGDAAFSVALGNTNVGDAIAATATNPSGSTSEFSACATVTGPAVNHILTVSLAGDGSGSVSSSPTGIDCPTDCTEAYDDGTLVTLTAVADSGSDFSGWSGEGCSGTGTCQVTMDAARSVTATFDLEPTPTFLLTVSLAGDGSGSVSSSPTGIDCPTDCTEAYDDGTLVTLTAVADSGSDFSGWSGEGCSGTGTCQVTMDAARSVTATFDLEPTPTFLLTVSLAGDGSGSVSSSPTGIDCPTDCTEAYDDGTLVTLTAVADSGSDFSGWSGEGCSGTGTCQVTMDAARSVTATFDLEPTPTANLSVTQTDSPDPVTAGNAIHYFVTVTNSGPDAATGVVLVDTLSAGSTLFAAESPGCTSASGVVTCTIGSLASGASRNISIVVLAPTVATMTTITNTATVSGNEDDPSLANNTSSEVTSVQPPATNPDTASGWITAAGGTVATNAGKPPTKKDPMTTAVTVPPGFPGMVTIAEGPITTCPAGVVCFGQRAEITAPTTTASQPLRLAFSYHNGSLPPATQLDEITMFHDGVEVARCNNSSGTASPDPCIFSVARAKGSVTVIVLSSENGSWVGGR